MTKGFRGSVLLLAGSNKFLESVRVQSPLRLDVKCRVPCKNLSRVLFCCEGGSIEVVKGKILQKKKKKRAGDVRRRD
jgi:hypothetical protein